MDIVIELQNFIENSLSAHVDMSRGDCEFMLEKLDMLRDHIKLPTDTPLLEKLDEVRNETNQLLGYTSEEAEDEEESYDIETYRSCISLENLDKLCKDHPYLRQLDNSVIEFTEPMQWDPIYKMDEQPLTRFRILLNLSTEVRGSINKELIVLSLYDYIMRNFDLMLNYHKLRETCVDKAEELFHEAKYHQTKTYMCNFIANVRKSNIN